VIRRLLVLAAAGLVVSGGTGAGAAGTTPKMAVTSPAFGRGEPIPDGFTCDGADASPPLRFRNVPKRAKELALVMHDPDVPVPGGFTHWVAWHLPRKGVPEETLPPGVVQGANGTGAAEYRGPCPPQGSAHHYVFTLYAVSKPIDLPAGATKDELLDSVRNTTVAKARLIGTYARATS
jgi:Raf kinase inhibitor-like YbhB/YbcL family protein